MEQIFIQVRDPKKANVLLNFLKTLDYVESVSSSTLPEKQENSETNEAEFFALAGLWAGRDITQESLRNQAWPGRV